MKTIQRVALREAGFSEAQTNALAMALEPLATREDLLATREDLKAAVAVLHNDLQWMNWVGGAIGLAVLAELVSGFFI